MHISVKCELDSRLVIYPLIRMLFNYGSILVITNNRVMQRLIDDPVASGFRNVTVLIDSSDSADEICDTYGIAVGDYDFVILDNIGTSECDAYIIAVSSNISQEFDQEIELIVGNKDVNSCLLQFGKAGKSTKKDDTDETPKERKERIKREQEEARELKRKRTKGEIPNDYDPAEKFRVAIEKQSTRKQKVRTLQFPSFQDIEVMESEHRFPDVDRVMADAVFEVLKGTLAVDKIQFQKEVRKKDEGGGNLKSRNPIR